MMERTQIMIEPEMKHLLMAFAQKEEVSMGEAIRRAIYQFFRVENSDKETGAKNGLLTLAKNACISKKNKKITSGNFRRHYAKILSR